MTKNHSNAMKHAVKMQKQVPEKHAIKHNKHNMDMVHDKVEGRNKNIPPKTSNNNATVLSNPLFPYHAEGSLKGRRDSEVYSLFKYTWQFWASVLNPWYLFAPFMQFNKNSQSLSKDTKSYILEDLKSKSWETETGYFYEVDLPEVDREQLMLGFHNGAIMLRVEELDNKNYRHPHFIRRAFIPPVYIDGEGINARLKNGKLIINIPKAERPVSPQSRLIDIV